jgi:hypothetical protein
VTSINFVNNFAIRADNASALADALKVNTSVTKIELKDNGIEFDDLDIVDELVARNDRLRHLFLFDARQMLLSVLCADECGVVWPYLLDADDTKYVTQASNRFDNVESLRAEFAVVVEERRYRAASAVHLVDAEVDEGDSFATAAKVAAVVIFSQFSTSTSK